MRVFFIVGVLILGCSFKQASAKECDLRLSEVVRTTEVRPPALKRVSGRVPTLQVLQILRAAIIKGASDVHLNVGSQPALRINRRLRRLDTKTVTDKDVVSVMKQITSERHRLILASDEKAADFAFEIDQPGFESHRFRVSIIDTHNGFNVVIRLVRKDILSMEKIKLPRVIQELINSRQGLLLVTGPTGSGKSTTVASMIDYINRTRSENIITLEDPIEFVFKDAMSLVSQRELGESLPSFERGIKQGLRQDPDLFFVGEMRDPLSIDAALTAADTGHLVFSTLHTKTAALTISRVLGMYPPEASYEVRSLLADQLIGVVSQRLLPRADGKGMVAAYEVMIPNAAIRRHIRDGEPHKIEDQLQTGARDGMILLDNALLGLVREGVVKKEDALEWAIDKSKFR